MRRTSATPSASPVNGSGQAAAGEVVADSRAVVAAVGEDLGGAPGLAGGAEPADLSLPGLLEGLVEVGVELLVVTEVHVLEEAGVRLDALAREGLEAVLPPEHAAAPQQHLAHLGAQPGEALALPLLLEGGALGGVAERLVAGIHQQAAGVEIAVAADRRRVPAEEAGAVLLLVAGGDGRRGPGGGQAGPDLVELLVPRRVGPEQRGKLAAG